jgi:hypothetical protein
MDLLYVRGPLKFLSINPGQQMIGSFHPITEGDWQEGAMINKDSKEVDIATTF